MELTHITVAKRFLGPPNSANGGYISGRVAAAFAGPAEVTLHRPPPLELPLALRKEGEGVSLYDGEQRLASAKSVAALQPTMGAVAEDQATAAATRSLPIAGHPLRGCFVCGPSRAVGDGLRIHVGPVREDDLEWQGVLAAVWIPHDSLADDVGKVRTEFVWAALDCPTGFAVSTSRGMRNVLLGRQTVHIARQPSVGETLIVTARQTGHEGRKFFADSALFDAAGQWVAACRAIWIEVTAEVHQGLAQ